MEQVNLKNKQLCFLARFLFSIVLLTALIILCIIKMNMKSHKDGALITSVIVFGVLLILHLINFIFKKHQFISIYYLKHLVLSISISVISIFIRWNDDSMAIIIFFLLYYLINLFIDCYIWQDNYQKKNNAYSITKNILILLISVAFISLFIFIYWNDTDLTTIVPYVVLVIYYILLLIIKKIPLFSKFFLYLPTSIIVGTAIINLLWGASFYITELSPRSLANYSIIFTLLIALLESINDFNIKLELK